jgi:hypothetical protein
MTRVQCLCLLLALLGVLARQAQANRELCQV